MKIEEKLKQANAIVIWLSLTLALVSVLLIMTHWDLRTYKRTVQEMNVKTEQLINDCIRLIEVLESKKKQEQQDEVVEEIELRQEDA